MVSCYQHVMSNMAIHKQNVHYTNVHFISLQVFRWLRTWNRVAERTHWWVFNTLPLQHTSHFSPLVRVTTQDMVGARSLQRLTASIVAGINAHLSHMPLFLFMPHIGHQKCDTVILSYHCPRYTGSYQTPTEPG